MRSSSGYADHARMPYIASLIRKSQLLTKDLSLAVSMSSICPGTEIDELTVCLLIVFEQRGRTFELLEALIKEEIEQTG